MNTMNPGVPYDLRCEYMVDPLGIDVINPRFNWLIDDNRRNAVQSAYQLVAHDVDASRVVWDSGCVESDRNTQIEWQGEPLKSRQRINWQVRTADADGNWSEWSDPALFEMGLIQPSDWQAKWIGTPAPEIPAMQQMGKWIGHPIDRKPGAQYWLKKQFELPNKQVTSAMLQAAADITFVATINGHYATSIDGIVVIPVEVTELLAAGTNTILVENRGHRESGVAFAASLMVNFSDGSSMSVLTDDSWLVCSHRGPWSPLPPCEADWLNAAVVGSWGDHTWGDPGIRQTPLTPLPMLRTEVELKQPVIQARAYVCGLGYYELSINGQKVDDYVLHPAQSDYDKQAYYTTHNIDEYVLPGVNAIGIILADGYYNQQAIWGCMSYGQPGVLAQIEVTYIDGSVDFFTTDESWVYTTNGPIRHSHVYYGEYYDANKELPGWDEPGYASDGWQPVVLREPLTPMLKAQMIPPMRKTEAISAKAMQQTSPGVWVIDMGQNFAGWITLNVRAAKGTKIQMRFAEWRQPDGSIDVISTGVEHTHVIQTDTYICKGDGVEVWEPKFCYHGFQFVEVTGLPGTPSLDMFQGWTVHTDCETAGQFACSDELINRSHVAALYTQRANMPSIPTDCPARERCGWLGDAHVAGEMVIYNWNVANFYSKYLGDIRTSLLPNGIPQMIAPGKRGCGQASVDWGTAQVQVPMYLYQYYGDDRALRAQWPHILRWMEYLQEVAGEECFISIYKTPMIGLGDWCTPYPFGWQENQTPPNLTTNGYFYWDALLASQAAALLGDELKAQQFADLAAKVKSVYNEKFYDGVNKTYGTQTASSQALFFGLVPDEDREVVAKSLAFECSVVHNNHISVGIMGQRYVYPSLVDAGYDAIAYAMLTQTTWPSLGRVFEEGGTTLWEVFIASTDVDKVHQEPQYSLCHPMQGGFDTFFYSHILGIQPTSPAFHTIRMKPGCVKQIDWASGSYQSASGSIVSQWQRDGDVFSWQVTIPENVKAEIWLPTSDVDSICEGGSRISDCADFSQVECQGGFCMFTCGSGDYKFSCKLS